MKCHGVRRLFGAYWDDETTQAEREHLEAHFQGCAACRNEYESFSRAMEMVAALPRYEAAPDLLERTLARARRSSPARDTLPARETPWVPVTAVAALLLVAAAFVSQWSTLASGPRAARTTAGLSARVGLASGTGPVASGATGEARFDANAPVASATDSLFDHSEDIEFVLDPVTLRRGQATVTQPHQGLHTERAVISF